MNELNAPNWLNIMFWFCCIWLVDVLLERCEVLLSLLAVESTDRRAKTTPAKWETTNRLIQGQRQHRKHEKQLSKREHDLRQWKVRKEMKFRRNKARYTATPIECAWAGAVCEIKKAFGQEQWAKIPQKCRKINKKWRTSGPTDGRNRLPATKKWGRKTKMWMYGGKRGEKKRRKINNTKRRKRK